MTHEKLQDGVEVRPESIAAFGGTAGGLAQRLRGAADEIRGGTPDRLGPGLGPIGEGFVAALIATQHAHERDVSRLVTALDGMALVAAATAVGYEHHDAEWSARLRDAGAQR